MRLSSPFFKKIQIFTITLFDASFAHICYNERSEEVINLKHKRTIAVCLLFLLAAARAEGTVCFSTDMAAALLTADGSEIIAPGVYEDIVAVADGLYALGTTEEGAMRYALAGADGQPLTDFEYDLFKPEDGAVIYGQDGRFGAMTADGEILLPAQYTQLVAAADGTFLATVTDPFDDDADEILILTPQGEAAEAGVRTGEGLTAFSDGRMPYQDPESELYGYLAPDGSIAVDARFETAGRFEDGAARASQDGKLGLIGADGEWLVPPEFGYLETEGGVTVGLMGRERFVVLDGEYSEILRIEGAGMEASMAGGYPVLLRGGGMEVYNAQGELILETDGSAAVAPGPDGQLILSDGEWGAACVSVVSPDGTVSDRKDQHLIALDGGRYAFAKLDAVSYYSEELEEIRYSCNYDSLRFGMMDAAGNEILPAENLEIRALGQDRFLAVSEDGLEMTDADGRVLWSHTKEE